MAAPSTLAPAEPAVGAPLPSDPGTLRLIAEEKRAAGELGDAAACERAAAALEAAQATGIRYVPAATEVG